MNKIRIVQLLPGNIILERFSLAKTFDKNSGQFQCMLFRIFIYDFLNI